jgi:arsenate reductase
MSESLLRLLGGEKFEVVSAGTNISSEVNSFAIEVLKERNAPIEGLHPKRVNQFTGESFDFVITVCDNARQECPHFPGAKQMLHWSLPDPASTQGTNDEILMIFRNTRDEIENRIKIHILGQ